MSKLILAVILAVYFAEFLIQSSADEGFDFETSDGLYKVVHQTKTWVDAQTDCKSNNMNLVTIEDQAKLIRVHFRLFKKTYIRSENVRPGGQFFYWLGGNNLKDPNTYIWAGTGKPIEYFHWLRVTEEQPGNCIVSGLQAFSRWSNATCENEYYYICEKIK